MTRRAFTSHHRHGGIPWATASAPVRPVAVRRGIKRLPPRVTTPPPLTDRHRQVLDALGPQPTRATPLAAELGIGASSVVSALYVLQARGLAENLAGRRGWVRVDR